LEVFDRSRGSFQLWLSSDRFGLQLGDPPRRFAE
jgi:hypothetical protein